MTYVYLDIETIPAQTEEAKARIAACVKCPGNIKKPESIAAWEKEQKPAAVEEAIAKSGLNAAFGEICCIGWGKDNGDIITRYVVPGYADERDLLELFFHEATQAIGNGFPVIVGHNVVGFDIRFIWQRAMVLGVRVPNWFPRDPKPWGNDCFDTMTAWAGARDTISMDNLALALGLPGKGDIDGSMVGQMFADGKHEEIADYCRQDVERTRAIHQRMMVAFGEAA